MFYTFTQNNTGGSFTIDPTGGITVHVVIEAASAAAANAKAESLGLYFNGVEDERDCECCGDRWHPASDSDATLVPSVYGIHASVYRSEFGWTRSDTPEVVVHYLDGRVVWGIPPAQNEDGPLS